MQTNICINSDQIEYIKRDTILIYGVIYICNFKKHDMFFYVSLSDAENPIPWYC